MITVAGLVQAPVAWSKTDTGESCLPKATLGIGGTVIYHRPFFVSGLKVNMIPFNGWAGWVIFLSKF